MAHYQNDPRPPAQDGAAGAEHLRYLLTAYLFGNISGAGRREVEEHHHAQRCAPVHVRRAQYRAPVGAALENGLIRNAAQAALCHDRRASAERHAEMISE